MLSIPPLLQPMAVYKDGLNENSPKLKPQHLDPPLLVGCTTGYKPQQLLLLKVVLTMLMYVQEFSDEFSFN